MTLPPLGAGITGRPPGGGPVVELPPELLEFQLTLALPRSGSVPELLASFDAYTNQGGPAIEVSRQVPLREVAGWRITADVYRPPGEPPFPTLVYLHGGAWVMGAPWSHRRLAADLAALGLLTVVVDYRRAPPAPLPGRGPGHRACDRLGARARGDARRGPVAAACRR
jgi:acetyl esterase